MFNFLESKNESPIAGNIIFDEKYIQSQWKKAVERKDSDPEGAITAAQILIENGELFVESRIDAN